MPFTRRLSIVVLAALFALMLAACGGSQSGDADGDSSERLDGDIVIDGSSTVYPITTAVAEEFANAQPRVRVSVGLSGTGGGFEKFCAGETDISDASRPIKDGEAATCDENGVEWTEFLVALDGLTVMVNPANDFVDCLTPTQLGEILGTSSTVTTWADVNPEWPAEEILFFIPDPASGTRDYMTEIVEEFVGDDDLRQDNNTTFSSDDNVLLEGIANEEFSFGFFGFAYYITNSDSVRAVPIQNDAGECVLPSNEAVQNGMYNPLSRPLFIYSNNASTQEKPQIAAFLDFYFNEDGGPLVMGDVGYSLPPDGTYEDNLSTLDSLTSE